MSYQELIEQIEHLPLNERLLLIETVSRSVRQEIQNEDVQTDISEPMLVDLIPGAYLLSDEDVDELMLGSVSPEELAEMKNTTFDPSQLPELPKTLAQYIIEDREDRI